jgi:hypothetical protein
LDKGRNTSGSYFFQIGILITVDGGKIDVGHCWSQRLEKPSFETLTDLRQSNSVLLGQILALEIICDSDLLQNTNLVLYFC